MYYQPMRGDPSFLGGLVSGIGKAVHAVAGVASHVLPGPLGLAAGAVNRLTGGGTSTSVLRQIGGPPSFNPPSSGMDYFGAGAIPFSGPTMPGGAVVPAYGGDIARQLQLKQHGHHWNKSTYVTRRGGLMVHPKGSTLVRNRSMNPGNGRAIRHAVTRLKAAERMFRHVFTVMHGKAPHGIKPKRGGRRRG